jgi:hypothetical protein
MDDALVGAGLHSFLRIICLDYIEKFQLLIYYYSAVGIGPADTESSIHEYFAFQTSCSPSSNYSHHLHYYLIIR